MNEHNPLRIVPELDAEPTELQAYIPPAYQELFPDAKTTFARHIAETKTLGDSFDRRKNLQARHIAAQTAAPLTLAIELGINGGAPTPLSLCVAAAGAGTAVWRNIRQDRKLFSKMAMSDEATAEVGQWYEIYRNARIDDKSKDADLELVWYEPAALLGNHLGAAESLRQMALLAKEHGIKRMHVDGTQFVNINWHLRRTEGTKQQPMHAYMQDTKGVHLRRDSDAGKIKLVLGTPDDWLRFVDEAPPVIVALPEEGKPSLLKIVNTLRQLKPEHPILPVAELYDQTSDEDSRQYFRRKLDDTMLQRLCRQEMYPERGREFKSRGRPFMPQEITDTELGYITQKADAIIWRTHRNGQKSQDIFDFFGLTQEEYDHLLTASSLDNPDLNVDTLVNVLELAIIRTAHGQPLETSSPHSEQREAPPAEPLSVLPLQHELKDELVFDSKGGLKRHRARQILGSAAALLAVGCGIYTTHQTIDAKEENAVARAQTQVANRHGIDPGFVTAEDARKHLDKSSWKWKAWHTAARTEHAINKSWDDILPDFKLLEGEGTTGGAASSSTESGVGNVELSDTPEFTITAHNGAKADGLWAAKTSSRLLIEAPSDIIGRGLTLTWLQDAQLSSTETLPQTPPKEYQGKPRLEVRRELVGNDSFELESESSDRGFIVNLPVLEKTSPIALSVNGKKANLIVKSDGTYGISTPDGQKPIGKLTYWLAPDPAAIAPISRGTIALVTKNANGELDSSYDSLSAPEIGRKSAKQHEKLSKTIYPDKPINDEIGPRKAPIERFGRKYSKHISNTWRYTHTPFKKDQEDAWQSLDDFVAAAKKGKKANCNVANTVAGLYDITSAQVMGYANHPGSGAGVLSAKEAHQKRTTGDATPKTQAAPTPPERPSDAPVTPLHIITLGAGILLVAERRRLRHASLALAKHLDDKAARKRNEVLAAIPDKDLVTAYVAVQQQLYAPRVTTASLQRDVARMDNIDRQQLLDMLAERRQYLRPKVAGALEMQAEASRTAGNLDLAETLRRSAGILRQVRQNVRDRDGEAGIAVSGLNSAFKIMRKPIVTAQNVLKKQKPSY